MESLKLVNFLNIVEEYLRILPDNSVDKFVVNLQFHQLNELYNYNCKNPISKIKYHVVYEDFIDINNNISKTITTYTINTWSDIYKRITIEFKPSVNNLIISIEPILKDTKLSAEDALQESLNTLV